MNHRPERGLRLLLSFFLIALFVPKASAKPSLYATADHATFAVVQVEEVQPSDGVQRAKALILAGTEISSGSAIIIDGPGLKGNQTYFIPITIKEGRWQLLAAASEVNYIHPRQAKSAVAEIATWQAKSVLPVTARLDGWLNLVAHPIAFLRAASAQALRHHRLEVSALMTPSRLDVLTTALTEAEAPAPQRRALLGLIAAIGGNAGADWIADNLFTAISGELRTRALHFLGRQRTPAALEALSRCSQNTTGASAGLCRRLLGAPLPNK